MFKSEVVTLMAQWSPTIIEVVVVAVADMILTILMILAALATDTTDAALLTIPFPM